MNFVGAFLFGIIYVWRCDMVKNYAELRKLENLSGLGKEKEKVYNSKRWHTVRDEMLEDSDHVCQICGKFYTSGLIVDHITPLSEDNLRNVGLVYGKDNLRVLCRSCHLASHNGEDVDPARNKKYRKVGWL